MFILQALKRYSHPIDQGGSTTAITHHSSAISLVHPLIHGAYEPLPFSYLAIHMQSYMWQLANQIWGIQASLIRDGPYVK